METLITGAFSQIQHVTTTQAGLVDKLSTRLDVQEKRSDERWIALQSLLTQWQQQSLSLQLRALGVEAGRRMLPLLPGMLSTLTGSDRLIPERAVEDSLFDTLLESTTPEQLQELLGTISSTEGGAALGAVLSDHLLRARKRKAARAKEHAELLGGQERSYDDAEADAAGVAGGIGKANGHANGHAPNNGATQAPTEPKTRAREAGMMPGDAMLDAMLLTLAEGEVAQVAAMFGAKRPDLPGLGDEIRARYVRLTGKAVP
jgi:hypothetical protein